MLNMEGKRRRGGYHQEDVCREREEGEDTTKKMLNIQVGGKRRRGGYHQEDVKHTSGGKEKKGGYHQEDVKHASVGKEKKGRIPPRRC